MQGNALDLGLRDATFDVVVSLGLCEYVADLDLFLAQVARVLRAGGQIAFTYHQLAAYRTPVTEPPEASYFGHTVAERSRFWSKQRHRRAMSCRRLGAPVRFAPHAPCVLPRERQFDALARRFDERSQASGIPACRAGRRTDARQGLRGVTQHSTGNVLVIARKRARASSHRGALMTVIPVFKPTYGEEELAHVRESLHSGWVGLGPKVAEFERRFAAYIGVPYMVGLVSGTAALDFAMLLAEVKGREVITTPLTFVSTNHAILYHGGAGVLRSRSGDAEHRCVQDRGAGHAEDTRNHDRALRRSRVRHGSDSRACRRHRLLVVEDCAHATGGTYKGRRLGSSATTAVSVFMR